MKKYIEEEYAYAVARIRVLERKLLDRTLVNRLIDAKSMPEVQNVLAETDYFQGQQEGVTSSDYEEVLSAELKKLYEFLGDLAPDREFFSLFLDKFDVHNIKVFLKEELQGTPDAGSKFYIDAGNIPVKNLVQRLRERDYRDMPKELTDAFKMAVERFTASQDPQEIDIEMDKGLYALMYRKACDTGNMFLKSYAVKMIDVTNIKTFFRLKTLTNGWKLLDNVIYENGTFSKAFFSSMLNESVETVAGRFKSTSYGEYVEDSFAYYQKTGTMTAFERGGDDMILEFSRQSRYKAFGVEPLAAYLIFKESEIKMLRMVLVGKTNQMQSGIIRERLGSNYA